MRNLKLIMFFTVCFIFAGMQYTTAQTQEKTEEVKTVKEDVKQKTTKPILEDDKSIYKIDKEELKKKAKTAQVAKISKIKDNPKTRSKARRVIESDSDNFDEDELDGDALEDDDY